jgi:hypothetical protein
MAGTEVMRQRPLRPLAPNWLPKTLDHPQSRVDPNEHDFLDKSPRSENKRLWEPMQEPVGTVI